MTDLPPIDVPKETLRLIDEYDMSKQVYDKAMDEAYSSGEKWPEEKVKLWARVQTRKKGYRDPDTYRWLLRARLGSILEGKD
jgi:hypothetical protein